MKKTELPKKTPKTDSSCKKVSKTTIIIFIILTVLMLICGKSFSILDWISHPQFTEKLVTKEWLYNHTDTFDQTIFTFFFLLDFAWAFILLYILGNYVCRKTKTHKKVWIFYLFIALACIAYSFDCTENFYYLIYKKYPETIVTIKNSAYALTFITTLLIWVRYSLKNRLVIFKEFFASSWISFLFLFIIGMTLPKTTQMNSIVVDLYYHPFWFVFVLLLFFAPIYCIVLSHYPNYFLFSRSNRKFKDKKWHMTRVFSIFGIIWYRNGDQNTENEIAFENYISFLRRVIGVFFYGALFYMISYTADTNFDTGFRLSSLTLVLMAGLIWWLYVLKTKKSAWKDHFFDEDLLNDDIVDIYVVKPEEKRLNRPIRNYLLFLSLTIIAHIILFILLVQSEHPYNYITVILSLFCITLQAITYTYYRTFRTLFKYVFFNEDINAVINAFSIIHNPKDERSYEQKKVEITQMVEDKMYFGQTRFFSQLSKLRIGDLCLGSMSNNIVFLRIIAYFGLANMLILLVINFFPIIALKVNVIILILSTFFLFYGIIVIILKHFIYYNLSKEKFATQKRTTFFFTVYTTVLVLVLLNFLARHNESTANNLFELTRIKDTTENIVTLDTYVQNLPEKRYYIGCYGGGMKANAWTMTVLNALDKNNTLYDNTVCLSGASGGTIGLINYSVIKHEYELQTERDSIIREISTENILSMDVAHLLGRDWITHLFVPTSLDGMDRSTAAMRVYAKFGNPEFCEDEFRNKTYRQYWNEMYQKRNKQFPILISNSTNIKGRQGMAVSIASKGIANRILYLGANDILELPESNTLSFYNAASTTNRFPLISPAATIETEGQYNDGGIFENSGLLSAYKMYEAINSIDSSAASKETVFINIVNDKVPYIKHCMDSIMNECNGGIINKSTEISAILNSVAATEMFPGYIKEKLQLLDDLNPNFSFETIYLPHTFTMEDIKAIYGEKLKNLDCIETVYTLIEKNNKSIKEHLKGASAATGTIIEPAMSRVMAIPAYEFMESMLAHDSVKKVLDKLR